LTVNPVFKPSTDLMAAFDGDSVFVAGAVHITQDWLFWIFRKHVLLSVKLKDFYKYLQVTSSWYLQSIAKATAGGSVAVWLANKNEHDWTTQSGSVL
jgi:hypothetical protein